jgi:hypothetical protein
MAAARLWLAVLLLSISLFIGYAKATSSKFGHRLSGLITNSERDISEPLVVWVELVEKGTFLVHSVLFMLYKTVMVEFQGLKRAEMLSQATQGLSAASILRRQQRGSLPSGDVVTLDDAPIQPEIVDRIKSIEGVRVRVKSKWLNSISCEVTEEALAELQTLPFVKSVELMASSPPQNDLLANIYAEEPLNGDQPNPEKASSENEKRGFVKFEYGDMTQVISSLNINAVHALGFTGKNVTVLVLDSGFNTTHTVFANLTIVDKWDFVNDDANVADEKVWIRF